jgi:hypothetical protein
MADNRLLAEVGFSLFGVLHTGYGRYIPLQGTYNNFVPQGRWFISLNLPFFKIKDSILSQIQQINATFLEEKKIKFFKTKEEESSSPLCPEG